MAGDVEIRGGGNLDGAMLRNAATESTLRELVNALNAKDGKSGNKAAQEHERAVKNNVTAIKSSSDNLSVYNNTISNLNKNSGKLRESFARMSNSTIGGVFSGIATVGKSLLGFFTDSLGSFRETSQVGATFNNDLIELRRTAASAAMPLDMFTDMLKNNSRILAAFGGTVTGGAQRFAELSKSLRTGDIGARFMGMGMTMSDLNESMAEYLDLEMRAGRLENRSNADLLQGTQNYIMEMDKLTKITGLSRRQQSEALRGAMADGRLLNLQNSLSGEALQRFRSSVTLMQANMDPQAMGTIINAMSGIIDPSDRFGKFMANAVPDFLSFNRAMGEGALTTEEVVEGAEKQIRAIDGYLAGYSREQIARTPELRRMREYQQSLRAMARANTASAQEEQARRNTITEAMGSFGQTIQKIKDDILIKLIDSNVFGRVQTALTAVGDIILRNSGAFGDGLVKIVDSIFKFIENIQSKGIGQAVTELLQGMFKSLARNVISSMFSLIADNLGTVLVGMAAGIAALFLAPWAGIFGAIGAAIIAVIGYDQVKQWLSSSLEAIKNLGTSIANMFNWQSISGFFTDAWNSISGIPNRIESLFNLSSVTEMFSSVWNTISGIPSKIMEFFNIESVGVMFSSAWNTISGIPSKIMEFFNIESVGQLFGSAWNTISGIPSKIMEFFNIESVSAMFSSAWNTISGIPTKILEFFNIESVSAMFSSAWNTISGIPTKILEFFNVDSVSSMFSNAWNTISGIPNRIRELFSLENLNLPKMSDLFNGLINTVRGFFNFDFQLPNIRDFLPSWLGGTGRHIAATQLTPRPEQLTPRPDTTSETLTRANARMSAVPDTTNTGHELDLDYVRYPETGRPLPTLPQEQIARFRSPENTTRNFNIDTLATELTSITRDIRSGLEMLAEQLNNLNTNNTSNLERLQTLSNTTSLRITTATNTMLDEQKTLNTLIAELRPVFEATRDHTKNVADSVSGRSSPL